MSKVETVRDLQNRSDFELVSNSQDIDSILEMIGYEGDSSDYGCLFVRIGDGEYLEVYGCESDIPYLHYGLDTLLIG